MLTLAEYQYLLSVEAIHERSEQIFQRALAGRTHFRLHLEKLMSVAWLTAEITRARYPNGNIPLHSRWRHFEIGGHDRAQFLAELPPLERVKSRLDLAMISVLLDAGAGSSWVYYDKAGCAFSRSEGLAIASLELFAAGIFSEDPLAPWRVDGRALQQMTLEKLASAMQVEVGNELIGLPGRLQLLQNLGSVLRENSVVFPGGRPGGLIEYLTQVFKGSLTASELANVLLSGLRTIWPGRLQEGYAMGDAWEYAPLSGWVPFHKLALWLVLSCIEPLQAGHCKIMEVERLPGLAEYRNGGLFIDGGVLSVTDPTLLAKVHQPGDELIVEWRALTLALLERLAPLVKAELGCDELPLACILQGGTWQAGRQLAFQRSPKGEPPLHYSSSGTLF